MGRDQMVLYSATAVLYIIMLSSHLFYLQEITECITDRDTWFKVRFCSEEQIHARLHLLSFNDIIADDWEKDFFLPSISLFEWYLPTSDEVNLPFLIISNNTDTAEETLPSESPPQPHSSPVRLCSYSLAFPLIDMTLSHLTTSSTSSSHPQ